MTNRAHHAAQQAWEHQMHECGDELEISEQWWDLLDLAGARPNYVTQPANGVMGWWCFWGVPSSTQQGYPSQLVSGVILYVHVCITQSVNRWQVGYLTLLAHSPCWALCTTLNGAQLGQVIKYSGWRLNWILWCWFPPTSSIRCGNKYIKMCSCLSSVTTIMPIEGPAEWEQE